MTFGPELGDSYRDGLVQRLCVDCYGMLDSIDRRKGDQATQECHEAKYSVFAVCSL